MDPRPVDLETAGRCFAGGVVAIGTFDGVHQAHRALLGRARARADSRGLPLLALTFEPHPKEVLLPRPPPRLTGPALKLRRLLAAGADAVSVLPFDEATRELSEQAFVDRILVDRLRARACFVGYNFSFGAGGRGRAEDLLRLGAHRELEVHVMEAADLDGIPLSSTSIRMLLACGHVEGAARCLGEPHVLVGKVVHGHGRGRELGFPTANLAMVPPNLLVPGRGVYAARARTMAGTVFPALVSIGVAPTFREPSGEEGPNRVEVHLSGWEGMGLYGEELEVALLGRIRDEIRFSSASELVEQITRDLGELARWREGDT